MDKDHGHRKPSDSVAFCNHWNTTSPFLLLIMKIMNQPQCSLVL